MEQTNTAMLNPQPSRETGTQNGTELTNTAMLNPKATEGSTYVPSDQRVVLQNVNNNTAPQSCSTSTAAAALPTNYSYSNSQSAAALQYACRSPVGVGYSTPISSPPAFSSPHGFNSPVMPNNTFSNHSFNDSPRIFQADPAIASQSTGTVLHDAFSMLYDMDNPTGPSDSNDHEETPTSCHSCCNEIAIMQETIRAMQADIEKLKKLNQKVSFANFYSKHEPSVV